MRVSLTARWALACFVCLPLAAAPPAEVTGVALDASSTLSWDATAGADDYAVYRGVLSRRADVPPKCHADELAATSFQSVADPAPGQGFFYVVTAESDLDGEGTPGNESGGPERLLLGACATVIRNHVLHRTGFGWDEWTRDRIATRGTPGYITEQLDPASIDEASNTELNNRLSGIEPPDNNTELGAIALVRAVYGRRQLEQQATLFYSNHFNTDHLEIRSFFTGKYADFARRLLEAATLQYRDAEAFRSLAFGGSFQDMAWEGVVSPAMLIYLDNDNNVAGRPNENLSREVLELLTMGVDNGYTQVDVEELARVLTGWNVCKKQGGTEHDPLAACVPDIFIDTPAEPVTGGWVRNFRTPQHDCGAKTLFAGTAYETVIPDTCDGLGDPTAAGIDDLDLALDAIIAHPSTAEFLTTKLLRKFVTEHPTQAMIDAVIDVWNDGANPAGVGDLREVLREVLAQAELMNPDQVGAKIKTPFEHVAGAYRATRGQTNGSSGVRNYLIRMQHVYFENPIPTGYSEIGEDWIDTNNQLERQNFGMDLTRRTGSNYGTDLIGLLQDNGVSTGQGNAEGIVDFFIDAIFGGALTPAERQRAIDYLNTDDNGVPSSYTFARIRETVGLLLGYAQNAEQ